METQFEVSMGCWKCLGYADTGAMSYVDAFTLPAGDGFSRRPLGMVGDGSSASYWLPGHAATW
jgi:hypothetical protein